MSATTPPRLSLEDLQRRFVDLRFGMFLHFGILTYTGSWSKPKTQCPLHGSPSRMWSANYLTRTNDLETYAEEIKHFLYEDFGDDLPEII